MSGYELISIGDASLDVFVTPSESEALCTMDEQKCLVCFSYGDKIPVSNLEFSVGGNAANNAVGVSRLGIKAAQVLTLGDDDIAVQIREKLTKEGVDTAFVTSEKGTRSNYSTIISYMGERTIFVYHAPRKYQFPPDLPSAPWAYLTSMGSTFTDFYKSTLEWLTANADCKLAFNPGSYQLRAGADALKEILLRTYVIFVNRQEAEMLTGSVETTEGKEKELLEKMSSLGPRISVITDGGSGSFVYDGRHFFRSPAMPVDSYERTGAGDAFGSGCLSAMIRGKSLEEALLWGTLNSASVIGYTGPQRGLLRLEEIEAWKERAQSSGVEVKEF